MNNYEDDPEYQEVMAGALTGVVFCTSIVFAVLYLAAKSLGY